MQKYRKKPVEIEATQLPYLALQEVDPEWLEELYKWLGDTNWESGRNGALLIHTLEGTMEAMPGDWIIRGVKGEFYPCKPDIFEATYDRS